MGFSVYVGTARAPALNTSFDYTFGAASLYYDAFEVAGEERKGLRVLNDLPVKDAVSRIVAALAYIYKETPPQQPEPEDNTLDDWGYTRSPSHFLEKIKACCEEFLDNGYADATVRVI